MRPADWGKILHEATVVANAGLLNESTVSKTDKDYLRYVAKTDTNYLQYDRLINRPLQTSR